MEKGGRTMLVTYMAVRDKNGKYLGTAEFVQDMEFAKGAFWQIGPDGERPALLIFSV